MGFFLQNYMAFGKSNNTECVHIFGTNTLFWNEDINQEHTSISFKADPRVRGKNSDVMFFFLFKVCFCMWESIALREVIPNSHKAKDL